jgi:transcription elongation GreA/GreB family factor
VESGGPGPEDDRVLGGDESDVRAARIGSRVWLMDESGLEDRFTIKLQDDGSSRRSGRAPLARAVLGRWVGEQVHVWTPTGARAVTIMGVD